MVAAIAWLVLIPNVNPIENTDTKIANNATLMKKNVLLIFDFMLSPLSLLRTLLIRNLTRKSFDDI